MENKNQNIPEKKSEDGLILFLIVLVFIFGVLYFKFDTEFKQCETAQIDSIFNN